MEAEEAKSVPHIVPKLPEASSGRGPSNLLPFTSLKRYMRFGIIIIAMRFETIESTWSVDLVGFSQDPESH